MSVKLETKADDSEGYIKFDAATAATVKASGEVSIPDLTGPLLGDKNQTWQNVAGSRSFGVTYTNTTGRPIFLAVILKNVAGGGTTSDLVVDGFTLSNNTRALADEPDTHFALVPNGSNYRIPPIGNTLVVAWWELR